MADYPTAAHRLKSRIRYYYSLPRASAGEGALYRYLHVGSTVEEAMEDTAAAAIVDYTSLADGGECIYVKVWKVFDVEKSLDSDINLSLTVGSAKRQLATKIVMSVTGNRWTLTLYDWSSSGSPRQLTGAVTQESGRVIFAPPQRETYPPPPVRPGYDDDESVAA